MSKTAVDIQHFIQSLEERYRPAARTAAIEAVGQFAEAVLDRSNYYCPQSSPTEFLTGDNGEQIKNPNWISAGHSGTLRQSGVVQPVTNEGDLITCELGYYVYYAAAVHEVLNAFHAPPTRAKFLETAMKEYEDRFFPFVSERINQATAEA